ncbi:hypothetical protein V1278_006603 [Bradyrhizobium sp. AZCC 1577]
MRCWHLTSIFASLNGGINKKQEAERYTAGGRREVVMSRIFGAVCQNGYVVRDIRAAMDHWVNVIGVGP